MKGEKMVNQIANVGIVVQDYSKVPEINAVLHAYSDNMLNRIGMPYRERNVRLINVMIESSPQIVEELNTKLSTIKGVTSKIMTFDL